MMQKLEEGPLTTIDYAENMRKLMQRNLEMEVVIGQLNSRIKSLVEHQEELQRASASKQQPIPDSQAQSQSQQNESFSQEKKGKQLRDLQEKNYNYQLRVQELQDCIKQWQLALQTQGPELNHLKAENSRLQQVCHQYKRKCEGLEAELGRKNNEIQTTISNAQERIKQLEQEKKSLANQMSSILDTQRRGEEKQEKIKELERRNQECEEKSLKFEEKHRQLQKKYQELARCAVERANRYQKKLIQQKDQIREMEHMSRNVEQFRKHSEAMIRGYDQIRNRNKDIQDYKRAYQQMQQRVKNFDASFGAMILDTGMQFDPRMETVREQVQALPQPEEQNLQKEIVYLKTLIQGFCFQLDSAIQNRIGIERTAKEAIQKLKRLIV